MASPTLYWKRGHLIVAAGKLVVAGAFAHSPVPLRADAPGVPGFSAHKSRLGAHRYEPRSGTLLGVELSPVVDQGNSYVTGVHQEVKAVELSRVCTRCGGAAVPGRYVTAPLDDMIELLPACALCATRCSSKLDVLLTTTHVAVTYRTADLERWSRMQRPHQKLPTQCACALTTLLTVDRGLHWYVSELWTFESPAEGGHRMRCMVCGAHWLYGRRNLPVEAHRID